MATVKPENQFIHGLHKLPSLKRSYIEKMYNPLRAGTPDVYYSGDRGDLWVEYKYIPRIPRTQNLLPDLSPRQRRWLNNRHDEGRSVAVIVGCPNGGVIYTGKDWLTPLSSEEFEALVIPKIQVAQWIFNQVGAASCLLHDVSSPRPKPSKQGTKLPPP